MEIRALEVSDDRSTFSSGDPFLDRFFRVYAGQNQFRHHIGVTYVATVDARILGYATVAPRHIHVEALPERVKDKLPHYPLPVLGLARLAVDQSARSLRVGTQLLRFVLKLATKLADQVGCYAVTVDAKPAAMEFYSKYGFRAFDALEGQSFERPATIPMYLMMRDIKLADHSK
jgi:GNAT superfamily N-acetyltransferase